MTDYIGAVWNWNKTQCDRLYRCDLKLKARRDRLYMCGLKPKTWCDQLYRCSLKLKDRHDVIDCISAI